MSLLKENPSDGTNRIRFIGYNLSLRLRARHPLVSKTWANNGKISQTTKYPIRLNIMSGCALSINQIAVYPSFYFSTFGKGYTFTDSRFFTICIRRMYISPCDFVCSQYLTSGILQTFYPLLTLCLPSPYPLLISSFCLSILWKGGGR